MTFQVTDNAWYGYQSLKSITINSAVSITTTSPLTNGIVGTAYSQTLAATGGTTPYTWSITTGILPAGLALNASSGAITGTPTTAGGPTSVTFKVTDSTGGSATQPISITINPAAAVATPMVVAGKYDTIGLKSDGTVVATGYNYYGECNVTSWTGITQIAAAWEVTIGLKSDGTVVATGGNSGGQCNVSSLTGIIQVAAGASDTIGLKSDGTVVATGDNAYSECDVGGWRYNPGVSWGGASGSQHSDGR